MTKDKQIIIDELKNEIACKENIINHLAEHNIKLQVQFKEKEQECEYWKHQAELGLDTTDSLVKELEEKEQECEELKNIINEAKNSKLDLKSFLVGEAVQNEYEQQLDQLKETIEGLLSIQYKLADNNKQLRQTLAEIKEYCIDHTQLIHDAYPYLYIILDKINEVENES